MKKINKWIAAILAAIMICTVFVGCKEVVEEWVPEENSQNAVDGMISGVRTGIIRQGISGQFKSFETTNDRVYFMVNTGRLPMLYSMHHDGDTLEPLCTLEGCKHDDTDCEASFGMNGNVCYYEGSLYVNAGTKLYRLHPDGGEREVILDVKESVGADYDGIAEAKLWNGVFSFYLTKLESVEVELPWGKEERTVHGLYDPYYFMLDGSFLEPKPMTDLVAQYNDGEKFIMRSPVENEIVEEPILYTWNPGKNSSEQVYALDGYIRRFYLPWSDGGDKSMFEYPSMENYEAFGEGYWGEDSALILKRVEDQYVMNNILCKVSYISGKEERLFDTGLPGTYKLCCFPDYFVLVEVNSNTDFIPDNPKLYVYNWKMESMGVCTIGYEMNIMPQDLICGETKDRIYLASQFVGVPEYYIDKAELGGEIIRYHELNYSTNCLDKGYQEIQERLDYWLNGGT